MLVTEDDVKKLAHLARIALHEEEFSKSIAKDLGNIFDLVGQISEINTENITAMEHSQTETLRTRPDVVTEPDVREEMLKEIPDSNHAAGFYLVPKVVE